MRARLVTAAVVTLVVASACGASKPAAAPPGTTRPTTAASATTASTTPTTSTSTTSTSTTTPTTTTSIASTTTATTAPTTTTSLAASTTTTPPVPAAISTEAQLLDAVRTEGLTPERAEQLFVLDIGPLPGVSVKGITPSDEFDGSMAVMDLYAEWDHLSEAQRHAASALTTSSDVEALPHVPRGGRAPVKALPPATAVQPGGPGTTASATPDATRADGAGKTSGRVVDLAISTEPDYLDLALQVDLEESYWTQTPAFGDFDIEVSQDMSTSYAETSLYKWALFPSGHWARWPNGLCHITVFAPKFDSVSYVDQEAVMAHEVFHCYQDRQAGSAPAQLSLSPWVAEGEATWVMAQLYPAATVYSKSWSRYTFTPTTSYVERSYDALGVYGHQGDVAGAQDSVWPLLLPVVSADIGKHDSAALSLLLGSDSERFYESWGASYYEDQSHVDWHMAGPGSPPTAGPAARSVEIDNGDGQEIGLLGPYQAQETTISGDADIVVVTLESGYGDVHDERYKLNTALEPGAPLALCLKQGGCKCPDGSLGASEHTIPATGPIYVGLDGGGTDLAAYAAGDPLSRFCKQPTPLLPHNGPRLPNPAGGAGTGGADDNPPPQAGTSVGDPHVATFDGRLYNLQAAGEFTMVKSTSGDFVVQVRTVPYPGSQTVAVNQAVATRLGRHRLSFEVLNGTVVGRVDGAVVTDAESKVGPGTLQIVATSDGDGYVVEWPDGTTLQLYPFGLVGLDVTVSPAADLRGKLEGLLGNYSEHPGDFITANGTNLGPFISDRTLYTVFANSWRITQAESLFDYAPGQSTATFTNRSFPNSYVNTADVAGAAQAAKACTADGITDKYLLQDCILDASAVSHGFTVGDFSFFVLSNYAAAQSELTVHTDLAHDVDPFRASTAAPVGTATTTTATASTTSTTSTSTPPPPTPTTIYGVPAGAALRVLVDSGRINSPNEEQTFSFSAHAGDVITFGPSLDQNPAFALVAPDGKTLDEKYGTYTLGMGTRFVLPATGTYKLIANITKQSAGDYELSILFEKPDVVYQAHYGEVLSGTITEPAAHVVYVFHPRVGDILHIYGDGCRYSGPLYNTSADNGPTLFEPGQPGGTSFWTFSCDANDFIQVPPLCARGQVPGVYCAPRGDWELVANWGDIAPLTYHFVMQTCPTLKVCEASA